MHLARRLPEMDEPYCDNPLTHADAGNYDPATAIIYVGITATGAHRWTQHSKQQPWWTEVATIRVEHLPSLKEVAAAELAAIRSENPRYNMAGR